MSLIKSIMHQLGLSGDPAKNFTMSVPAAPDGTMKLARGNAGATTQDIMTVDAAGKVAFPQNVQSWQNLSGSRALGTTYTNGTGQPIQVAVAVRNGAVGPVSFDCTVAGILVTTMRYTPSVTLDQACAVFDVPAGATYVASVAGTGAAVLWNWAEKR